MTINTIAAPIIKTERKKNHPSLNTSETYNLNCSIDRVCVSSTLLQKKTALTSTQSLGQKYTEESVGGLPPHLTISKKDG